jgi:hypothetical protein
MTGKRKIRVNPAPKRSFRNLKARPRKPINTKQSVKKRVQAFSR